MFIQAKDFKVQLYSVHRCFFRPIYFIYLVLVTCYTPAISLSHSRRFWTISISILSRCFIKSSCLFFTFNSFCFKRHSFLFTFVNFLNSSNWSSAKLRYLWRRFLTQPTVVSVSGWGWGSGGTGGWDDCGSLLTNLTGDICGKPKALVFGIGCKDFTIHIMSMTRFSNGVKLVKSHGYFPASLFFT